MQKQPAWQAWTRCNYNAFKLCVWLVRRVESSKRRTIPLPRSAAHVLGQYLRQLPEKPVLGDVRGLELPPGIPQRLGRTLQDPSGASDRHLHTPSVTRHAPRDEVVDADAARSMWAIAHLDECPQHGGMLTEGGERHLRDPQDLFTIVGEIPLQPANVPPFRTRDVFQCTVGCTQFQNVDVHTSLMHAGCSVAGFFYTKKRDLSIPFSLSYLLTLHSTEQRLLKAAQHCHQQVVQRYHRPVIQQHLQLVIAPLHHV